MSSGVRHDDRVVGERYRLDTLLATGGMGQVWRARDLALGRPVAVKVLRPEYTGDRLVLSRFRCEAQLSAGLTHPNITAIHDYGEAGPGPGEFDDSFAYLVMELVDGEPLSNVLRRERRLDPDRTLQILRQAATGLAAAHAVGIVHRDLKPGNLLIGRNGTVKITDFGIAWSRSRAPLTATGAVIGTAEYLSPEQARGNKAGPASDVYALGMVAYECLAGRRAFKGENPMQVALMHVNETPDPLPPDVPDSVRHLVARILVKDPGKRIPDAAALLSAVEDVLTGRPLPEQADPGATTVLPVGQSDSWAHEPPLSPAAGDAGPRHAAPRRGWSHWILVSLVVLLALVAVGAGLLFSNGSPLPSRVAGAAPSPGTPATSGARVAVRVIARDYVGRPVSEVAPELTALGLTVQLRELPAKDAPDRSVVSVDPEGELSSGMTVTVTYSVVSPTPDHATAESTVTQSTAVESTAPQGTASQSTATRQGKGNAGQPRSGPRR